MDETVLLPGARFRLGQVELELLEAPSAEVVPAAATTVITPAGPVITTPGWKPRGGARGAAGFLCVVREYATAAGSGTSALPDLQGRMPAGGSGEAAEEGGCPRGVADAFVYSSSGHGSRVLDAGTLFFILLESAA